MAETSSVEYHEVKNDNTDRAAATESAESASSISKQSIVDCVDYENLFVHQKLLYYVCYPLLWLFDLGVVVRREWIQIPLITYSIEVTELMIAISFVEVHVQGLEARAVRRDVPNSTVLLYLLGYTVGTALISLLLLYFGRRWTISSHYNYFVHLCTSMVAYGWLYLCVLVQYKYFSHALEDAWLCFVYLFLLACVGVAVIVALKQFIFTLGIDKDTHSLFATYSNLTLQASQENAQLNHDSEMAPLVSNINHSDRETDHEHDAMAATSKHFGGDNEYFAHGAHSLDTTQSFWYTLFYMLQHMWSVALGFLLVECVVFTFVNVYVDLLVRWNVYTSGAYSSILDNQFEMKLFGLALAVCTCLLEGFAELRCKTSCYRYIVESEDNAAGYHRCVVSMLNWLEAVSTLWFDVLAACIGWSLLIPNQSKDAAEQALRAVIGTVVFLFCGVWSIRWKQKKVAKILSKMQQIREDASISMETKQRTLMNNTQRLIFYEKLSTMYNQAFAIGVSFAWESLINLASEDLAEYVRAMERDAATLVFEVIYAAIICAVFGQLALFWIDIREHRISEYLQRKKAEVETV